MEKSTSEDKSEIREFFEGRSVLITGACGYLGTILLEQLLRLCPGIVEIFILVRGKKGSNPIERMESLLNKPTFWKVKRDSPEVLEKVHVVSGDLTNDDVGVSPEDLEKLKDNVSIIFHCAASISFSRDLRFMLMNNVVGTYNIITLCKKLPKIAAFVYTSTAYSNPSLEVIKEEVLHIPVPMHKIIEAARSGDENFIKALEEKVHGQSGDNRYMFSKSIAENLVVQEVLDIPVAIVRPSIISHVWKGSLPVITGFTRVLLLDENKGIDTVPADIVANTLIATAWSIAKKRVDSPLVLNCISSNTVFLKHSQMFDEFIKRPYSVLCPNTFRTPKITYTHTIPKYLLMSFLYQRIPAYILDTAIMLCGGTLRITEVYKFFDQESVRNWPFTVREFRFESTNFDNMKSILSKIDREIFNIDLTGYNFRYITENIYVNEGYQFRTEDIEPKIKQALVAERITMLTKIYECFLMVILFTFAWFLLKLLFRNII